MRMRMVVSRLIEEKWNYDLSLTITLTIIKWIRELYLSGNNVYTNLWHTPFISVSAQPVACHHSLPFVYIIGSVARLCVPVPCPGLYGEVSKLWEEGPWRWAQWHWKNPNPPGGGEFWKPRKLRKSSWKPANSRPALTTPNILAQQISIKIISRDSFIFLSGWEPGGFFSTDPK